MFWENEYDYTIIDADMTDEVLKEFLKEHGITLSIVDNSTRWCAFAQYYARHHGFDVVHATSFSYMVSLFMTGMGISASTEMYIKEATLEYDLINKLNEIKSTNVSEEEHVKNMFNTIFNIYSTNISDYEYATERVSFKLTPSQMKKFQSIPGKNNKEKFKKLLENI